MFHLKPKPVTLIGAVLIFTVGVGGLGAYFWVSNSVDRDFARLRNIVGDLTTESNDFSRLRVARSTHPKAWVFGTVTTEGDLSRLRNAIAVSFGPDEAARIVSQVRVQSAPATRDTNH